MFSFFDIKNLECRTNPETKVLVITINHGTHKALTADILLDLTKVLGQLSLHTEIDTIILEGKGGILSCGIDHKELARWSCSDLNVFNETIKKIVKAMHLLPQTIIVDLGKKCTGHALELALGADIRVASTDALLKFDFLSQGLCPSAGGIVQLQKIVGYSIAKYWILSSHTLSKKEIKNSPFIHETYRGDRDKCIENLLASINETAPVARVQAKRSFFEALMHNLDRADSKEGDFARAAHLCEDWKLPSQMKKNPGPTNFTSLQTMKKIVQSLQQWKPGKETSS